MNKEYKVIYVSPELHATLKEIAKEWSMTMEGAIKLLLKAYKDTYKEDK